MLDILLASIRIWPLVMAAPVHEFVAYFYYAAANTLFYYFAFLFIETSLIRLSIDWYWRRTPPYNDDFLMRFFTLTNVTLSCIVSGMICLAKDKLEMFFTVQGIKDLPKMDFGRSRIGIGSFMLRLVDSFIILVTVSQALKMIVSWKQNRTKTTSSIEETPRLKMFNNSQRNNEVVGARMQVVLLIVVVVTLAPLIEAAFYNDPDHNLTIEERGLLEFIPLVSLYVIVPLVLYIRSPKLRRHILNDIL